MNKFRLGWLAAAAAAAALAACGGGGSGDQTPRVKYGKLVSFGDSLSDVGSYAVGVVAAQGGGKYNINGAAGKNWTELLATQAGVAAPCAAQTGLQSAAALGGPVAVVNHTGCYGYAQGGARVTNPIGPANAALLALGDASGALGQLTDPVVNQITRHLAASGGSFAADDLVTVMAGGNDLFMDLATIADPTAAVTAMGQAGAELAGYIKAMVLAKGAQRVVVVNLPDVSQTPFGLGLVAAQGAAAGQLVQTMVTTFNQQLASGLAGQDKVVLVDAYTVGRDQTANPAQYGLTNVTTPACDLTGLLKALPTSLVCTAATLIAGQTIDTHYEYADTVHPTPYGYRLLAQLVTNEMAKKGWL